MNWSTEFNPTAALSADQKKAVADHYKILINHQCRYIRDQINTIIPERDDMKDMIEHILLGFDLGAVHGVTGLTQVVDAIAKQAFESNLQCRLTGCKDNEKHTILDQLIKFIMDSYAAVIDDVNKEAIERGISVN